MENYTIFSLTNRNNHKRYFGICKLENYRKVVNRYNLLLENNLHPNKHLQNSYNCYWNRDLFEYSKEFTIYDYKGAEIHLNKFIDKYKTNDGNYGYNYKGCESLHA